MTWFSGGDELGAKLDGCLQGAARDELWNNQKEALAAMETAESAED